MQVDVPGVTDTVSEEKLPAKDKPRDDDELPQVKFAILFPPV